MRLLACLCTLLLLFTCSIGFADTLPVDLAAFRTPGGVYAYPAIPWGTSSAEAIAALPLDFDTAQRMDGSSGTTLYTFLEGASVMDHPAAINVEFYEDGFMSISFLCRLEDSPEADLDALYTSLAETLNETYGPPDRTQASDDGLTQGQLWIATEQGAPTTLQVHFYAPGNAQQVRPMVVLGVGIILPREPYGVMAQN